MSKKLGNLLQRAAIVVAWLVIWQIAASIIDNRFLFCGPVEAVLALIEAAQKPWFWESIAWSFARIGIGFALAFVLGCIFGVIASAHNVVARFLSPAINVVKSAPVVCIIAILLVLFGSQATTSIVVAMVVFPPIYASVIEGSLSRDASLDEMAHVFGVSGVRRVLFIDFAQYAPFLRAALKVAIAMSWKAGVAAELIGLPGQSIGEAVYLSKLTLDVAMIVAWTAVVILIGWLCERLFLALLDCIAQLPGKILDREVGKARMLLEQQGEQSAKDISLVGACDICADGCVDERVCFDGCAGIKVGGISKSFGEQSVFSALSLVVSPGERICIMAPSGAGKTTLLKMIARLELVDAGGLDADDEVSFVFQDNRLVKAYSAAQNLALSANDTGELAFSLTLLEHLIPDRASWEGKAAKDLSGGMKRRVEIARALAHRSCVVLMDEPFSGLDGDAKRASASVILESLGGRVCVVATHDEGDAALLDARVVRLDWTL